MLAGHLAYVGLLFYLCMITLLFDFTGYADWLFCLCGFSMLALQTAYADYPGWLFH
jgi:hypothetical protein